MLDKHRAPVAPRTPDFWNRDVCCHHTESNALPTELRDRRRLWRHSSVTWPDLVISFTKSCARFALTWRRYAPPFFRYLRKTSAGCTPRPAGSYARYAAVCQIGLIRLTAWPDAALLVIWKLEVMAKRYQSNQRSQVNEHRTTFLSCCNRLTLAPLGGGGQRAPCGFSQIAPEVLGISLWKLRYLSGKQFQTLC